MQFKNLERAGEIAHDLPLFTEARKMLSSPDAAVVVKCGGQEVALPSCVNMNVLNYINLEINTLRKEVDGL